jgi:hypothetical protein
MGRYYIGDIEGKFWFSVQNSDDADNFGVYGENDIDENGEETGYLNYYFEKSNIPDIQNGINECLEFLGQNKQKFDGFFDKHESYNDQMIVDELGIPKNNVRELLEHYARLHFGKQILECVEEKGSCRFQANKK